ncbi:MAG: NAD(P)-dependent glycerol-3-phosphate dehydrogenase [Myxococcota bacterium]|nr:NAD(P)-dependent glycerol-3-phosphate dehydrogenase [Myxococcota bacterium]
MVGAVSVPIAVLGAGSFGTCLAVLCSRENDVRLWARSEENAATIQRVRRNPHHLSDLAIPDRVTATSDLDFALEGAEFVIVALPSHAIRQVMTQAAPRLAPGATLICTAKGIEFETGMLMHRVLADVLGPEQRPRITCLSGPSFAREVAQRKPTVVTIACEDESHARAVQSMLSCPWFRCYSTDDVVGVEVGGALKNVIAIAVGIADGMELGLNARAALMTRGLAEVTRLAMELGGRLETLGGLSGMGDLLLTCTGDLSRNRRVGLGLGRGRPLDEIIAEIGEVAEGVRTTRAACRLAEGVGVELPIAEMVRRVLEGEASPAEAGEALMTRQLGPEYKIEQK